MPFETALAIAAAIIGLSLIGLVAVVANRRRAAQEDELRQGASARGWQFESVTEQGFRVHRWRGATDGVAWTAESRRSLKGSNQKGRRPHIARWRTASTMGVTAPILCMGLPKGTETPAFAVAEGDGWLAQLAQKAAGFALDKAVDTYFGDDLGRGVDAGALKRVEGQDTPGFVVMAADRDAAARTLFQGLRGALVDAANDRASVLSLEKDHRPWILIAADGVALGRSDVFRDVNDVDAFAHAGVKLVRVATFGRPSFS